MTNRDEVLRITETVSYALGVMVELAILTQRTVSLLEAARGRDLTEAERKEVLMRRDMATARMEDALAKLRTVELVE